jgi:hypothetical protein
MRAARPPPNSRVTRGHLEIASTFGPHSRRNTSSRAEEHRPGGSDSRSAQWPPARWSPSCWPSWDPPGISRSPYWSASSSAGTSTEQFKTSRFGGRNSGAAINSGPARPRFVLQRPSWQAGVSSPTEFLAHRQSHYPEEGLDRDGRPGARATSVSQTLVRNFLRADDRAAATMPVLQLRPQRDGVARCSVPRIAH